MTAETALRGGVTGMPPAAGLLGAEMLPTGAKGDKLVDREVLCLPLLMCQYFLSTIKSCSGRVSKDD